jgi:hypothetical protein
LEAERIGRLNSLPPVSRSAAFPRLDPYVVTLIFSALTIAFTWPLAKGLTRDMPGDLGDPLFSAWALAWDATHFGRGWLQANIFYPHPLTLAYSELLVPQALQILPVYVATGNPFLCYNLVFLSTFVLSGLGMFLFCRELTGSRTAGLVAGLAFAFAPYRVTSIPHLQVMSAQWLPFVLFGLRRFFDTGRSTALAGATAAWVVQNLSCGYYLFFFSPAIAIYIVWEVTRRQLWHDTTLLRRLAVSWAAMFVATAPFLLVYYQLRRLGFEARFLAEAQRYSADVYSYFTADPDLRLWGSIARAWPKPEALLFPGVTIVVLAVVGATPRAAGARTASIAVTLALVVPIALLLLGVPIRLPGLKITSLWRALTVVAALIAIALWRRPDQRRVVLRWLASPGGFFALLTAFALVMSFGPAIHARGRVVASPSLYALFYYAVPGFDGLRVPARFAMLAACGLATLVAVAVAAIERTRRRRAQWLAGAAGALILFESLAVPIPINQNIPSYTQAGLSALPESIDIGAGLPDVYRFVARLPPDVAILELPVGEPAFDIRYMFYSIRHWRPLVNGYSGGAPKDYEVLTEAMKDTETRPERAWTAIRSSLATHVIVHEGFYLGDDGRRLSEWLRSHGARDVAAFGRDHVLTLR